MQYLSQPSRLFPLLLSLKSHFRHINRYQGLILPLEEYEITIYKIHRHTITNFYLVEVSLRFMYMRRGCWEKQQLFSNISGLENIPIQLLWTKCIPMGSCFRTAKKEFLHTAPPGREDLHLLWHWKTQSSLY